MRDDAIFCVGCGYDLRSLGVDGPCPECGRAIAASLGGRRLAAADPQWLTRLAIGQSVIAWGLHVALAGFCLMPLLGIFFVAVNLDGNLSTRPFLLVFSFLKLVLLGGTVLVWVGAILVTAPDPSESGAEPANSARRLARWCLAASIVFVFLAAIITSLPVPLMFVVVARLVLPLLAAVSVTVGITALLHCLAARASRIPDQTLARRTYRMGRVLRYLLPAFLIAMVIAFSLSSLRAIVPVLRSVNLDRIQATIGLAGLAIGCVVLFLLARLSTMMRGYRRAFRAARDEARQKHVVN